jgi:hypothetical protein
VRIVSREGVSSVHSMNFSPILHNATYELDHVLLFGGTGGYSYQARRARGFEDRTWPIVAGRVPCSLAYANPVLRHSRTAARASFSEASSLVGSGCDCVLPTMFTKNQGYVRYNSGLECVSFGEGDVQ